MIQIADISFYQDKPTTPQGVDFHVMRQKSPAVIIRAGQNTWTDKCFADHWKRAKEAGLKRGAYWFYDERTAPKRQAEIFAGLLRDDPPEFYAWLDAENYLSGLYKGPAGWYDFMEYFKQILPDVKQGVYTGYYYWRERVYRPSWMAYFMQYPLWIALYGDAPKIPPPWKDCLLWQYTSNGPGAEWGVESRDIDLNYYYGADFEDVPVSKKSTLLVNMYGNSVAEYEEK